MFNLNGVPRLFKLVLSQSWDDVLFRAHTHPKEVSRWTRVQFDENRYTDLLPLHQTCSLCPSTQVVQVLLSTYPRSSQLVDSYFHRTPLHIACLKGGSADVIRLLIEANEEAVQREDALGRLPLHYAVCSHAPAEIIQLLLDIYPEGAQKQDRNGWLAVHVGLRHGSTDEIVRCLLASYPNSVLVKTRSGMTPLMVTKKFDVCTESSKQNLLKTYSNVVTPTGSVSTGTRSNEFRRSRRNNPGQAVAA